MPNYSLVIDSTFQPFTYQELTAPLDRAEAYHEKLAQEYDNLSSQADLLKLLGDNEDDKQSKAYARYQAYSDLLKNEAENLYRYGLNVESRRRLSDMRRTYNTDIVPIQNAYNKRKEEADAQQALINQGHNVLFTRDANKTSIDDYLANPLGGYGTINLDNIAKDMYASAKELAKQIGEGRLEGIDPYTAYYIREHGLDANVILGWMNDPSKSPALTAIRDQVLAKHGVTAEALQNSPNRDLILNSAMQAAQTGAWGAIGEDKGQVVERFGPRLWAREDSAVREHQRKKAMDAASEASSMPVVTTEGAGIETAEGYVPNANEALSALKGAGNNFKESVFGKSSSKINPMTVYEDYMKEVENNGKKYVNTGYSPSTGTVYTRIGEGAENAKEKVLKKYAKYGVSDILTKDQYNILKSMGYDNTSSFSDYSSLENDLGRLAIQHNRYSTNMASYDWPDEQIRKNLTRAAAEGRYGSIGVWDLEGGVKKGNPSSSVNDLNLYGSGNTKGNKVVDIQYDPQFKGGYLVVTLSNGNSSTRKIVNANVIDEELAREIRTLESPTQAMPSGFNPQIITARVSKRLNDYNKTKSKSDKEG